MIILLVCLYCYDSVLAVESSHEMSVFSHLSLSELV